MQALRIIGCRTITLGLLSLAAAVAAIPGAPRAQEKPITAEEFRKAIAERDKIIIDLMRRVKALEEKAAKKPGSTPPGAVTSQPATPKRGRSSQAAAAPARKPGPGQVVVDELTAERALERSLVETGASLLKSGHAEISPGFTFLHNDVTDATAIDVGDATYVADRETKQEIFDLGVSLRYGLPWDSQFELSIPYRYVSRDRTTDVLGSIQASDEQSGHGIGDLRVGFAKTLSREGGGWPEIVGRITWDTGTGKDSDNGVGLGFGFDEVQGQLIGLFRQDPMVFVGMFGYEHALEKDGVQPGDEFRLFLGTSVAISPETSISLGLDQIYRNPVEVGGTEIEGTDRLSSSLTLGTSTIVGPRTLLRFTAGIGLTDDAPDYSFGVSLPIRFKAGAD